MDDKNVLKLDTSKFLEEMERLAPAERESIIKEIVGVLLHSA